MKELSIGEVTYSVVAEDGSRTYGIKSYDKAFEVAGRNVGMYVADRGGFGSVRIHKETVVGIVSARSDKVCRSDPSIREKLSGLVDELIESCKDVGADSKAVRTAGRWTGDVCRLISAAVDYIVMLMLDAHVGKYATLKADGADETRHVATSDSEGIDSRAGRDGDASIVAPEVQPRTQRGEFLRLLDLFAMEFVALALDFYKPTFKGGEICFECRDFAAAEKRARALKRLAAGIEELEDVYDVGKAHALIIAYRDEVGGPQD